MAVKDSSQFEEIQRRSCLKDVVRNGIDRLTKAGIADAKTDVFLLLEKAAGITRARFLMDPLLELDPEADALFQAYLSRRAAHEPCQYILGQTEFYGLPLMVNEHVLIPRQDTELLIAEALKILNLQDTASKRVLDLCTGSGAIAIAIAAMCPVCKVTAIDISEQALLVAEKNAEMNGVRTISFVRSDLFSELDPDVRFDLIVSNPPYISDCEYEELMPEVKDHEPSLALKAGIDGLDCYRRLIAQAPGYLNPEGVLMVEIGYRQADAVTKLFQKAGFTDIRVMKDLAGLDRVVFGRKPPLLR